MGRMGGGGYRPSINPYINYGLHYSPETKYAPQAKSTRGYSPYSKKNEPERYLPEKAFQRNQIDMEQILRELEKRFDEKLLEKINSEFEKLEREAKKTNTEIDATNNVELDNDKKESIADKLDLEEKDEHSENTSEEKSEVKESIEDKEEQAPDEVVAPKATDESQKVELIEDVTESQVIESELEDIQETEGPIESLPENVNEVESPIGTQGVSEQAEPIDELEELPIESFDHDIEELYTELYEIKSEPIEEVEPLEETEGY